MRILNSSLLLTIYVAVFFLLGNQQKTTYSPTFQSTKIDHTEVIGSLLFLKLLSVSNTQEQDDLIEQISKNWNDSFEIMLLESFYFTNSSKVRTQLFELFIKKTKQSKRTDLNTWFQYVWNKDATYGNDYFEFKANLHQGIDSKFRKYFSGRSEQSLIRLDEVRWGGVLQDGIPPLRKPVMITAEKASYLKDSNIVFGIEINGETRAYPKRILAWHEMFTDKVGGVPVAGVYCTLCGTVILYKTEHNGTNYELGTSGFLYRSNKLMYDKATQSLWSTLEGQPVIGPLTNKGIELEYLSVVTTTWGQWKELHPETLVLSLNTGHNRNYDEGVAYQDYFATDDLMFTIPNIDTSLKNKDEILSIRLPQKTNTNLAVSSKYLKKHTIFQSTLDDIPFTVFTDKSGAHRVYFTKGLRFKDYDKGLIAIDEDGTSWSLEENRMVNESGTVLDRFPSHNAFWFGYKAAFPDTELIK